MEGPTKRTRYTAPEHQRAEEHIEQHRKPKPADVDESMDPLEESGGSASDDDVPEEVDDAVAEDMQRFSESFANINQRYRLLNRIGEGTFSTVYKAEDLLYERYENDWDTGHDKENQGSSARTLKQHVNSRRSQRTRFVAIKKIYVTSSPVRIMNELELLHDLRDSPNVCPLITAFRHQDQVIAILPFFSHKDFREYFREFTIAEMRVYFHSLFTALRAVHDADIIHRDIKPTNFLYSPTQRRGVLVDFGLAEREGTDASPCNCLYDQSDRLRKAHSSVYAATLAAARATGQPNPRPAYPVNDPRPSRRANRAGTRGFRAPEVLLKCTAQTCQIDVWSCAVILLTFLTKRFPFFHSADDIDAFIELCTIFGKKRMQDCAMLHGQMMHCNLPTIKDTEKPWDSIILWCQGRGSQRGGEAATLSSEEQEAVSFMKRCFELHPLKRITADDALRHPFLAGAHKALADELREAGYRRTA